MKLIFPIGYCSLLICWHAHFSQSQLPSRECAAGWRMLHGCQVTGWLNEPTTDVDFVANFHNDLDKSSKCRLYTVPN